MRAMFLGLLLLAAVAAAPATAQNSPLRGLNGANDALAWQAIGRLDADGLGFCTATLIDPETVLTAAHCVFSRGTGEKLSAERMIFRAGLRNGQAVAERRVAQVEPHPTYQPKDGITAQNVRHDVALLRLEGPVPTHVVDPYLVLEGVARPGPVSVVSYGRGREEVPSKQAVCQMLGTSNDIVTMDCDVTFGSSGAPVFSHVNGRGRIVSLISGRGNVNGRAMTFGMTLPRLVDELRRQMRANQSGPVAEIRRITIGAGNDRAPGAKFVRP